MNGDISVISEDEQIRRFAASRKEHFEINNKVFPANKDLLLGAMGQNVEIVLDVDLGECRTFELNVLRRWDRSEYTAVRFYRIPGAAENVVSIDSTHASMAPEAAAFPPLSAPVLPEKDGCLRLHVFVYDGNVEVFANGKKCLAGKVFPSKDDSKLVSITAIGSAAVLRHLDLWQIK